MIWADNLGNDLDPFKGPFKGKGVNRKAVRILQNDLESIIDSMREIINQYDELFPANSAHGKKTRLVRLNVHFGNTPQMWWRDSNNRGGYIKLFESDKYRQYLTDLLPATRRRLIELERSRLRLNLKSALVANALQHYRKFIDGNALLDEFVSGDLVDAPVSSVDNVNG